MKDLANIEVKPWGNGEWVPADNASEVPAWVSEAVGKAPAWEERGRVEKNGSVWRWADWNAER